MTKIELQKALLRSTHTAGAVLSFGPSFLSTYEGIIVSRRAVLALGAFS